MATIRAPYNLEMADTCANCRLRGQLFFCGLPPAELRALNAISYPTVYPEASILFVEGQMPRGVYLLCRGRAKLSMVSSEGKTIILRIAEAGEVLGLSACMLSQPYQATVEALNPCQLNFIRREDFLRFIRGNPEALFRAAEFLSREYSSACHEISSLGLSHSAAEKTARLLLQFHRVASAGNGNGALLKLTVTHEEMAQMIGASRETVTRMLARFRVRGYIEIRGANLRICDHAALQALAENHRPPPASLPATASGAGRLPQKPAGDSTVSRSGSPRRQIALVAAD